MQKWIYIVGTTFLIVVLYLCYGIFFSKLEQKRSNITVQQSVSYANPVIEDSVISSRKGILYLDLYFKKDLTCDEAISTLNITSLVSHGRTYSPICNEIEKDHVKIAYRPEGNSI